MVPSSFAWRMRSQPVSSRAIYFLENHMSSDIFTLITFSLFLEELRGVVKKSEQRENKYSIFIFA